MRRISWIVALPIVALSVVAATGAAHAGGVAVSVHALVVYGELDAAKASRAVQEELARSIGRCRLPDKGGALKLSFLIDRRGVPVATVVEGSSGAKTAASCVHRRVQAARFPRMYNGTRGELRVEPGPAAGPAPQAKEAPSKQGFEAPSLRLTARGPLTTDELLKRISSDHWMSLKKCFPAGRFDVVRGFFSIWGGKARRVRLVLPTDPKKKTCLQAAMEAWTFPKEDRVTTVSVLFTPQPK